MKLTEHFTLEKLCAKFFCPKISLDPERKEDAVVIENLRRLAIQYLEPLQKQFGKPLVIMRAYPRNVQEDQYVSGNDYYHNHGLAADIRCDDLNKAFEVFSFVYARSNHFRFRVNQLAEIILYDSNLGPWVHIALRRDASDKRTCYIVKKLNIKFI